MVVAPCTLFCAGCRNHTFRGVLWVALRGFPGAIGALNRRNLSGRRGGCPGDGTPTGQQDSAQTVRPGHASVKPHRLVQAATMARPRPPSAIRSRAPGAGTDAPPSSVTATRATPSRGRSTSTVNTPPCPEAVCAIALAQNSDTHVTSVSLAGHPASSSATNPRASRTDAGVARNVRVHGVRVDGTGPVGRKEPNGSTG
jgi:hypothetical protein